MINVVIVSRFGQKRLLNALNVTVNVTQVSTALLPGDYTQTRTQCVLMSPGHQCVYISVCVWRPADVWLSAVCL